MGQPNFFWTVTGACMTLHTQTNEMKHFLQQKEKTLELRLPFFLFPGKPCGLNECSAPLQLAISQNSFFPAALDILYLSSIPKSQQ